jgi:hypothetical protein
VALRRAIEDYLVRFIPELSCLVNKLDLYQVCLRISVWQESLWGELVGLIESFFVLMHEGKSLKCGGWSTHAVHTFGLNKRLHHQTTYLPVPGLTLALQRRRDKPFDFGTDPASAPAGSAC